MLAAIGPVWDGNEVWLVASGGVLFFAFPRAYAAAFSGFYLPLMIVLWLLVLRGLSIEFRGQWANPLWRAFFDAAFAVSSTLLAFVLGVSLGNVVRGVPLDADGAFAARRCSAPAARSTATPCSSASSPSPRSRSTAPPISAWKCEGDSMRAAAACSRARSRPCAVGLVVVTVGTWRVQPALFATLRAARRGPGRCRSPPSPRSSSPGARSTRGRDRAAFLATTALLATLLAATAASLYPDRPALDDRRALRRDRARRRDGPSRPRLGPHLVAARARPRRRLLRLPVSFVCGEGASVSPLTRASATVTASTKTMYTMLMAT